MEHFDIKSDKAAGFINQQEIIRILSYAKEHCLEKNLALEILKKAEQMQGLSAEETAVLLLNQDEQLTDQIFTLATNIVFEQLLCEWLYLLSLSCIKS